MKTKNIKPKYTEVKLPKTWGQLKPVKMKGSDFFNVNSPFSNIHKANKPKCRFCGGKIRALNISAIIGTDHACTVCGKVQ